MTAPSVIELVKAEGTDDETRQRILEYERSHQNRRTVVGALEQAAG